MALMIPALGVLLTPLALCAKGAPPHKTMGDPLPFRRLQIQSLIQRALASRLHQRCSPSTEGELASSPPLTNIHRGVSGALQALKCFSRATFEYLDYEYPGSDIFISSPYVHHCARPLGLSSLAISMAQYCQAC